VLDSTKNILDKLDPVSLEEMDNVKLMNRMDTKCIFSVNLLNKILTDCSGDYKALFHAGTKSAFYKTLYFDTPELKFYFDHHNGRAKRFKVRMRNYTESNLFYLELKYKRYGRTDKKRIKVANFSDTINQEQNLFLEKTTKTHFDLKPVIWNNFHRITLVNKKTPERVTIDTGIAFDYQGRTTSFDQLVIGEIKQERTDFNSPILHYLKKNGVRPSGMSKYCLGMAVLNNQIKHNIFKERILNIQKIQLNK
jgi:VTC domain